MVDSITPEARVKTGGERDRGLGSGKGPDCCRMSGRGFSGRRKLAVADIILMGDSLVEFFDWQERFPGHRVFNLGLAGETVEGLLGRTAAITASHSAPDFVFIMTGINNVAMEETGFIEPYAKIVRLLKSAFPAARIYVLSILPTLLDWVADGDLRRVNAALKEMAEAEGARYLDLYGTFKEGGLADYLLSDGVHLSEKGYAVWAREMEDIIKAEGAAGAF
jgi:lysophospholipase L1-like esterase